jgi:hypothetical protein
MSAAFPFLPFTRPSIAMSDADVDRVCAGVARITFTLRGN